MLIAPGARKHNGHTHWRWQLDIKKNALFIGKGYFMDIATLIFIAVVAFFAWRGYQKGLLQSVSRLLGWVVAYPAAIFFTKPFAKWLIANTTLDGIIVYFVAGTLIFIAVSLLVSLLLNVAAKWIPETDFTERSSKVGGASVGTAIGAILGLLVVYLFSLIHRPAVTLPAPVAAISDEESAYTAPAADQYPPAPSISELASAKKSFIEASAKKLIGGAAATAVDVALDDPTTTQITRAFVEDPQVMLTHVQAMTNSGEMRELMSDARIQSMLTTGDVQGLMRDADFQAVMNNEHMRALMAQADVTSEEGVRNAAEKMVQAWSRVDRLKHDPRVIAIVTDPDFQQQLNSPNKLSLMMNPKLNQLTELIFSADSPAANGMGGYQIQDGSGAAPTAADDKPKTIIYRWTDENGRVHYSDKPLPGATPVNQ